MRKLSVFLFLVLLKNYACYKKTLPVVMMDHDAVMSRLAIESNPFEITHSNFFTELAIEAGKRTACVVIFIEDSLCTEDISTRDQLGTPFFNLRTGIPEKKVVYFPAITEPYNLLQQIFEPHVSNIFHLGSGEKLKILQQHDYVYIYFNTDSLLNRQETLRKHDLLMKEAYATVRQKKKGPVLAFYTGKKNPISMAQLKHSVLSDLRPSKEQGVLVVSRDALFRLTGVSASSSYRRSTFEDTPVVEYEIRSHRSLSTTMLVTDYHLQFNFEFEEEKWILDNVALLEAGEEVGRTRTSIEAPWLRSYYCSEPITIFNLRDGSYISISEYQVEPLHESRRFECGDSDFAGGIPILRNGSNSSTVTLKPGYCSFSKSQNCGPYFNTPILSGLFVFFIFTMITLWGVIMLFNCQGCNRYDEVNQKPLVIVAESGGD